MMKLILLILGLMLLMGTASASVSYVQISDTIYVYGSGSTTITGGSFGIRYTGQGFFEGGSGARHMKVYNNTILNTANGIDIEGDLHYNSTIFNNNISGSSTADIKFGHYYVAGNVTPKFINNKYSTTTIWTGKLLEHKYLDVKVVDSSNTPINGATIDIVNDVDSEYPSINISGDNKASFTTGVDGHTPLPIGNESNSIAILDFWKGNTSYGQQNMTYTITASKIGYSDNSTIVTPTDNWYRSNINAYDNTVTIILSDWVATPNHMYPPNIINRIYSNGTIQWIGTQPAKSDTDLGNIRVVVS